MSPRDWRKRTWDGLHKVSGIALRNGKVLGQVAHAGYKAYKKQKLTPMESTLSNQYNAAVIFRRKKNSRRSRRKYTFARRVQKAAQTFASEKTVAIMRTWGSAAAAGVQNVRAFSLYGSGPFDADLNEIFSAYNGTIVTTTDIELCMRSAHVDYLCSNVGSTTMVLKVYTVIPKEDVSINFAVNVGDAWTNALSSTSITAGTFLPTADDGLNSTASAVPSQTRPGSTPFDSTVFCQKFTILKVTEFILPPGQTASFNDNYMKSGNINSTDYGSGGFTDYIALRGWTKTQIFVHHGLATSGAVTNMASFYPTSSLAVIANKTYKFTVTEYKNRPEIAVQGTVA